jgi:hypothetical protein
MRRTTATIALLTTASVTAHDITTAPTPSPAGRGRAVPARGTFKVLMYEMR